MTAVVPDRNHAACEARAHEASLTTILPGQD